MSRTPVRRSGLVLSWHYNQWLRLGVLAVAIMVFATVGGLLIELAQPPVYVAQAEIIYDPDDDAGDIERLLTTQEVLLTSTRVLQPVSEELGVALSDLEDAIEVSVIGGSQVLRLTVTDSQPQRAQQIAQAITDRFIDMAHEEARAGHEERAELINSRIEELQAQINELQIRLAVDRTDRTASVEIQILLQRVGSLQDSLTAVELQQSMAADVSAVAPAQLTADPIRPAPVRGVALGAVLGLVVAAGAVATLRATSRHDG